MVDLLVGKLDVLDSSWAIQTQQDDQFRARAIRKMKNSKEWFIVVQSAEKTGMFRELLELLDQEVPKYVSWLGKDYLLCVLKCP